MGMLTGTLMAISTNHNSLGVSENGVAPYFLPFKQGTCHDNPLELPFLGGFNQQ